MTAPAARRWQGLLRAAPPGTGVIAGGPMRAVMEVLGVQDVVAKSVGSSNPYNMVRATFDALKVQATPRQIASKRGLKVQDIVGRRTDGAAEPASRGRTTEERHGMAAKKTVRQIGSRPAAKPARHAGGLGLNKSPDESELWIRPRCAA